MNNLAKILGGMFAAVALFVIVAFIIEMFDRTSTEIFEIALSDKEIADVIVITSTPYNEKEWAKIKNILEDAMKTTIADTKHLNEQLPNLLVMKGYSVISINVSRKVITMSTAPTKKRYKLC